ncbi:sulfurtransferase [Halorubrum gandharaense]
MGEHVDSDRVVSVDWLADRLDRARSPAADCRVLRVNRASYDEHVPGSVPFDWASDLQRPDGRGLPDANTLAHRLGRAGIAPETTVVVYGDDHNLVAGFAYWLLRIAGHSDVRLLDGGRERWLERVGRTVEANVPSRNADPPAVDYDADALHDPTWEHPARAGRGDVRDALDAGHPVVDVRTRAEFLGDRVAPPGFDAHALVGGRIPSAKHLHWERLLTEDGTFRPASELADAFRSVEVSAATTDRTTTGDADPVVVYCKLGKRSSTAWVALTDLLDREAVANYDGSWTEWGNLIGAPVAVGPPNVEPPAGTQAESGTEPR